MIAKIVVGHHQNGKKKKAGKDMTLFQHQMTLSHWPTTWIGAGGER
jgi:hypothetical protein